AAHRYGEQALQIATTIKLERVLWLIPLSFIISIIYKTGKRKITVPWFILYFIAAMLLNTLFPAIRPAALVIVAMAKKGLTLTLFLVGAGLSGDAMRSVGFRPVVLGVLL